MQWSGWDNRSLTPERDFRNEVVREIDIRKPRVSNPFFTKPAVQTLYPCAEGAVFDGYHGARPIARCGRWTCKWCGPMKKRALCAEIGVVREQHRGLCIFSILTFVGSKEGRATGRSGRAISIETQKQYVRKWYGLASAVLRTKARVSIPEWHKSGIMHMNVLWFGVPRDYWDCGGRNRWGKFDTRLTCRKCDGCELRRLWECISGAPRSTHEQTFGRTSGYAAKYLMKDLHQYREGTKRFSWSRAAKRPPAIMPAYLYLCQELWNAGKWHLGRKKGDHDVEGKDYIAPSRMWWGEVPKFVGGKRAEDAADGMRRSRELCSSVHGGACDSVPYFSRSREQAWGGADAAWAYIARTWGADTVEMLRRKLGRLRPHVQVKHDAFNRHFQLAAD